MHFCMDIKLYKFLKLYQISEFTLLEFQNSPVKNLRSVFDWRKYHLIKWRYFLFCAIFDLKKKCTIHLIASISIWIFFFSFLKSVFTLGDSFLMPDGFHHQASKAFLLKKILLSKISEAVKSLLNVIFTDYYFLECCS